MDSQRLQELEHQCIQDEPPACSATCPVHVDVRALLAAARDDLSEARRLFMASVPFPRVIAHCCDAPCQTACVREQAGGGIRIRDLERASLEYARGLPPAGLAARRAREGRVAVIGAGLSGLTAALDLARKGYSVEVFEAAAEVGGRARDVAGEVLEAADLAADCAIVSEAGALITLSHRFALEDGAAAGALAALAVEFDAVYLALGVVAAGAGSALGLQIDDEGAIRTDPVTLATSEPGVYVGGSVLRSGAPWSPITSIADGRRAALSIDRQLQRVSLAASRSDRAGYASRLIVNMQNVESAPPTEAADPSLGYSEEEAVSEAERCLQCECLECVKACAYLEAFGAHPGRYARRIYNNLTVTQGRGTRQANKMIDSCSLCRLCYEVCPTDLDMADVIRDARREMVRQNRMPASAFDFAMRDLELAVGERSALARHAPGTQASSAVFFPGCQLAASDPAHVERTYAYLRERLSPQTGLLLYCCGAPADWAGREQVFAQTVAGLRERLGSLGRPRVILACPTCQTVFAARLPEFETVSLWEVLRDVGLPDGAGVSGRPRRVAVHDACTARYQTEVQNAVRELVVACGCEVDELGLSRERTECCGFGGLMLYANPAMASVVVDRRVAEGDADFVAYCAMCRDRFAAKGKRTLHLLDLFFGDAYEARAERRGPVLTQRSEQRAALKQRLLVDLWHEGSSAGSDWRENLILTPEVQELLEQRFIRPDEVSQVIAHREAIGDGFVEPATGHLLATLAIGSVTYWAEYVRRGDRFLVLRAYSHRMEIKPPPWPAADALEADDGRVWRCARGDHELEPRTVTVSYLVAGFPVHLPACPKCGLVLVSEQLATGRMLEVERALEDK